MNLILSRLKRLLPAEARVAARRFLRISNSDYLSRIEQESRRFAQDYNVHDLPPIFHYWSNKYLRPLLEGFGFSNPDQFFVKAIIDAPAQSGITRVLSIGSGNCDTEIRVAQLLTERGFNNWNITCLDLVPEMLERGKAQAIELGVASNFSFVVADFNKWRSDHAFDVVIANQCLHHVVELEALFDNLKRILGENGRFAISDMIGRNGHQRWPEARKIVDRYWDELPVSYRYNRQLEREEPKFKDWDCSVEGFEGIRSQDILPLLCEKFHFETFIAFGNAIDPFIDRSFGWNFNAEAEWDRDFIDRVHATDASAIEAGTITPTHLMSVCTTTEPSSRFWMSERDPRSYIRGVSLG